MRTCCRCKEHKEEFEFYPSKRSGYSHSCKKCETQYRHDLLRSTRLECLMAYCDGQPRCMCPGCTEDHLEFLAFDHIEGGGNGHRKELGRNRYTFYRWLKNNKFPPGFRVLCHNCNFVNHFYGGCPHNENKPV